MSSRLRDNSLGQGVFFATEDYVGILRRIVIQIVDSVVLVAVFVLTSTIYSTIVNEFDGRFLLVYATFAWLYLTVFKASRIWTVGYWIAGCRIVNLRGKRPSVIRMTFRLLLWVLGPFNTLLDLIWCGIDDDRQTLRDRFAGTYVVNGSAQPIGTADIHLAFYSACGFALRFPRVERPKSMPATPSLAENA